MSGRLTQLDALRGIAVLMVVLFHYTTRFQQIYGHPDAPPFEMPFGHYGVELFFMISGFVIFLTLEGQRNWRDFVVSRFARLFPAYWVAVLLTYSVVASFPLPHREVAFSAALANLSMLQEWLGIPHVDGVYWTLSLELSFYCIMLGLFASGLLARVEWVALAWLAAMLAALAGERAFDLHVPSLLRTALLLDYANLFMAGIAFYRLHRDPANRLAKLVLAAALLVEAVLRGWPSTFICLGFFVLFVLATARPEYRGGPLGWWPLIYLGEISYSLYLLHQNIGYVLLRAFYRAGFAPTPAIATALAVLLILAGGLNRLVEKPARDYIRSAWRRRRQVQAC